jgi:hypothetical protein
MHAVKFCVRKLQEWMCSGISMSIDRLVTTNLEMFTLCDTEYKFQGHYVAFYLLWRVEGHYKCFHTTVTLLCREQVNGWLYHFAVIIRNEPNYTRKQLLVLLTQVSFPELRFHHHCKTFGKKCCTRKFIHFQILLSNLYTVRLFKRWK